MITDLYIENFKSIQSQELELGNLNILIGPNGAGKSNFISFFKFVEQICQERLQEYVFQAGGINNFLFQGFEVSQSLGFIIHLKNDASPGFRNVYHIEILSDGESYNVVDERVGFWDKEKYAQPRMFYKQSAPSLEARLKIGASSGPQALTASFVYKYLTDLRVFHFHDTSDNAQVKLPQPIEDTYFFKPEAENLAPLLLHFQEKHSDIYLRIVETVRLIYPFFQDFVLEESPRAKGHIALRWREKHSGQIFSAKQISDGTLRFICLAALLIQPPHRFNSTGRYVPGTIILDEPELGLHPFALQILAELMHKAAQDRQLIVATQSVSLINYFQPEDLLITERGENGATQFRRLKDQDFESWLKEYSLGQLWESNLLGGRP